MKTSQFDFSLPQELIAKRPVSKRDSARMLHVSGDIIADKTVPDITSFIKKGDVVVFNDTKVVPAHLIGKRGDAHIEVTLHKMLSSGTWTAFAKPAKKLKAGDIFTISDEFYATVVSKLEAGEVVLEFNVDGAEFDNLLAKYGKTPIPPYISKSRKADDIDKETYQTIYAKNDGAVAAPTAGLHFTEELFEKIDEIGVQRVFATLHVGAGTFLPVKTDNISDHKMHSEWCSLSAEAADTINTARKNGGRVIAIGSTSLRILESIADEKGFLREWSGETDIFITPEYRFKIVDIMFTNFHIPRSTLYMLVCAFAGTDNMHAAYSHAISQKYRFYSYGDACLLERFST